MFVYPTEYESIGELSEVVSSYSLLGIFLFQITMFGFFSSIFGEQLTGTSFLLIAVEIIYYIGTKIFIWCKEGLHFE